MERRQPIVLAGRVTSVVGELVPKTLRGTRGERIAVDVAQHVEHMTLVTIRNRYRVVSGFPEMPGPTKQAIQRAGKSWTPTNLSFRRLIVESRGHPPT